MSKRFWAVLLAASLVGATAVFHKSQQAVASHTLPSLIKRTETFPQVVPVVPDSSNKLIAEEVRALVTRWSGSTLRGAGWVHLVTRHQSDQDEAGILPNGQPIPLDYVMDEWYQLDQQKQVLTVISIMKDENDRVVQVGTFQEGLWRNSIAGEAYPGEAALYLDFGFSRNIEQATAHGKPAVRYEASMADRPVVTFAIGEQFDSPLNMAGYTEPVVSAEHQATFDSESGQLLSLARVFVMGDGEQRVVETTTIIAMESVREPPAEVLEFLK